MSVDEVARGRSTGLYEFNTAVGHHVYLHDTDLLTVTYETGPKPRLTTTSCTTQSGFQIALRLWFTADSAEVTVRPTHCSPKQQSCADERIRFSACRSALAGLHRGMSLDVGHPGVVDSAAVDDGASEAAANLADDQTLVDAASRAAWPSDAGLVLGFLSVCVVWVLRRLRRRSP